MERFTPSRLPPPFLTSEPGSFARRTFEERIPRIIEETIAANDFPSEIAQALVALRSEILNGVIAPLREDAPDQAFWEAHSQDKLGRSWLDVPWYWAESFFYRRVLQATRYFQPGPWFQRDPYAASKDGELEPTQGPHTLHAILRALPGEAEARFRALMYASLWGNRADLSYRVAQNAPGSLQVEREYANLVVDDAARVWEHLQVHRGGRVDWLCDNAGTELFLDFALADFLLETRLAEQIVFHCKPQPYFVSDAMLEDVRAALAALARSPFTELKQLAARLEQALRQGRWKIVDHWFWATCLFFFELTEDLAEELSHASLVVSKGDANYRRWLGDGHWPPTTPFAEAVDYWPAPLVALRTLKAELIVGLRSGQAESLQAGDPTWLTNGKRGLVQFKA